ncbi:hypothetical protein K474DRAFT_1771107 [Panus rudis PR-1116 ss-1]|nr:hypothetical protein K474DRAFT_1771107 [Panus rudis PR-1116 ss-1]
MTSVLTPAIVLAQAAQMQTLIPRSDLYPPFATVTPGEYLLRHSVARNIVNELTTLWNPPTELVANQDSENATEKDTEKEAGKREVAPALEDEVEPTPLAPAPIPLLFEVDANSPYEKVDMDVDATDAAEDVSKNHAGPPATTLHDIGSTLPVAPLQEQRQNGGSTGDSGNTLVARSVNDSQQGSAAPAGNPQTAASPAAGTQVDANVINNRILATVIKVPTPLTRPPLPPYCLPWIPRPPLGTTQGQTPQAPERPREPRPPSRTTIALQPPPLTLFPGRDTLYRCLVADCPHEGFTTSADRDDHMNSHLPPTEQKRYRCPVCFASFISNRGAKEHVLAEPRCKMVVNPDRSFLVQLVAHPWKNVANRDKMQKPSRRDDPLWNLWK